MSDMLNKLHFGDPTLGWEGDENLILILNENHTWELHQWGDDGKRRCICVSKPYAKLDEQLIRGLISWDMRRKNVIAEMDKHNALLEKQKEQDTRDRQLQTAEHVAWAIKKDLL